MKINKLFLALTLMLVALVSTSCNSDYNNDYYNDDNPSNAPFLGTWKYDYEYGDTYVDNNERVTFYSNGTGVKTTYSSSQSFNWWYSRSGGYLDIRFASSSSSTVRLYWRFTTDGYFETSKYYNFSYQYSGYRRVS